MGVTTVDEREAAFAKLGSVDRMHLLEITRKYNEQVRVDQPC